MVKGKSLSKGLNEKKRRKPERYKMMAILMVEEPLAAGEFARILAARTAGSLPVAVVVDIGKRL